jgi:DNA-binding GntR family transcriptional regulator
MMKKVSLISQKIEQALKEDIFSGKLQAGEKISISALEHVWGTSSTPVRDAIKSLESKGFLIIVPRESITIANLNSRMIKDVFELRIALECAALESSTTAIPESVIDEIIEKCKGWSRLYSNSKDLKHLLRIDHAVHQLILDYCDNKRLVQMLQDISDLVDWTRSIGLNQLKTMEFSLPEQMHILNMIRRRNIVDAQEAMRIHLKNLLRRTIEAVEATNGRSVV